MTDPVKLARENLGPNNEWLGQPWDARELARAVLDQHDELVRLRDQVADMRNAGDETKAMAERDRLRDALKEALDGWEETIMQHGGTADLHTVAKLRKEFGL